MKFALIDPQANNRIAEVANKKFPFAAPLYWVECPNDCVPDLWVFNGTACVPPPKPTTVPHAPPGGDVLVF